MVDQLKKSGLDGHAAIDALHASLQALRQGIDSHCCLVSAIAEKKVDAHHLARLSGQCPRPSREALLKGAIREAIEVLDQSRKAFKSKQLERLRKTLTDVLMQTS